MKESALLLSLPAMISLILKGGILAYARCSGTKNKQTKLYLYFLFVLAVLDIAEISHFFTLSRNAIPYFEVTVFYAFGIIALALFFHLSSSLGFDQYNLSFGKPLLTVVYSYAVILELLLIFSPWLISDFVRLGYSATRVPGPLYLCFELYAIGLSVGAIGILIYGTVRQATPQKRAKASITLLAIIPAVVVVVTVLSLLHFGIRWFNASVVQPIAFTYFLVVTAYAIHQHRLFDIQFYIPWSNVRKRKTAFYDRIRAMITEIADLGSVNAAISRLADTLRCPVALLGSKGVIVAQTGASRRMSQIPQRLLYKFDDIVVTNEIADVHPETHTVMKRHAIAAIVPFYPHTRNASGWLLLGDSFSEQVYTPLDFQLVEQLFDKMADLFLDKLLAMRAQLADARNQIQTLERRLRDTDRALVTLQGEVDLLQRENTRLVKEQPVDSLDIATLDAGETLGATITLLGRDKTMLKRLRNHFPQVAGFVGPHSVGFKRQSPPDVLICRTEADGSSAHRKLVKLIHENRAVMTVLVYGPGASDFASKHRGTLLGSLVAVLPDSVTEAALIRKIRALAELRNAARLIHAPDYPLIGRSQAFSELLLQAEHIAGFKEPVVIEWKDAHEAIELARYMHGRSGNKGKFNVVAVTELERKTGPGQEVRLVELLADARDGTLMIDNLRLLPGRSQDKLRFAISQADGVRVIAGCDQHPEEMSDILRQLAGSSKPFVLAMPGMQERKADIPLLVHYYTLQFNLQACTHHYLSQREVDEMMAQGFPTDLAALKLSVFVGLLGKARKTPELLEIDYGSTEKSLDEHVAEFEARLIAQTFERCDGNKSKAARLLGLRPNTLHYKMERYGLSGRKKR